MGRSRWAPPAAGRADGRRKWCRRGLSSSWQPGWSGKTGRGKPRPRYSDSGASRDPVLCLLSSPLHELVETLRPQLAGRALAAAVTTVMTVRAVAQITAMGNLHNERKEGAPG